MAYDRYDTRDEHPRSRDREDGPRSPGRGDNRGFFERAGDEIASWFGDDRPDRPREQGRDRDYDRDYGRDYDRGYGRDAGRDREPESRDRSDRSDREERYRGIGWPSSERDYNPRWRSELRDRPEDRQSGGYRPMTGDYGRSEDRWSPSGGAFGGGSWRSDRGDRDRSDRYGSDRDNSSEWDRDPYRSSSRAGTRDKSDRSRDIDPHYRSWRDQHMGELDRDYADYRREHQAKFDQDFSSWRERRTQKRGLLGQIREHMDVVGKDDEHVGTVDRVAGDRIILTKSDPESGGAHHSISCAQVDRVEDGRVVLECSADQARKDWRDESRSRALFEREDSGEMGNHVLNRSFEGTYR